MEKSLKTGIILNSIFALLIVIADINFGALNVDIYITKTIASVLFVIMGVFNFIYCLKKGINLKYSLILCTGLIFACIGDILLIDYFILGAAFFAIGHIFYFIAFCFFQKFQWFDIFIGLVIYLCITFLFELYPFDFEGLKVLIMIYALIISLMLGKSISNIIRDRENKLINIVILLGASLFFFSDAMLLFYVFGNAPLVFDYLCIGTYYPAQILLAFSIFAITYFNKNKK